MLCRPPHCALCPVASLKHLNGIVLYLSKVVISDNRAICKKVGYFPKLGLKWFTSYFGSCCVFSLPHVWTADSVQLLQRQMRQRQVALWFRWGHLQHVWFGGVLFWRGHFCWFTSYNCLIKLQTKHIECIVCRNWPRMHLLLLLCDWFWLLRSNQAFNNPHTDKYKLNK